MSRIRSLHPGFFTDERLVSTSIVARMLFLGLGVEADDKGVFEWKPVTLKMRIFPADSVDVAALLAELEREDVLRCYEIDGRKYGAIRNFRKHQRPKTPNDIHPITPEFSIYVGLSKAISENDEADQGEFPQKGEKQIQMEDGGDKGNSSLRSESILKETRERDEFSNWFLSWPTAASDNDDDAFSVWRELSQADRSEAISSSSAYLVAASKGGRTTLCSAANYLRKRMWTRLRAVKPAPTAPPKTPEQKAAERAAHIRSLMEHNQREIR